MIDAILFDLGDTIINFGIGRAEAEVMFRRGAGSSYRYLNRREKVLPEYETYFKAHYRKMRNEYVWSKLVRRDFNYADVITSVTRRLGIPVTEEERRELAWLWYEPIVRAANIDTGLHDMLAELRAGGMKLAIVSNTFVPGHCLDRHLEQEGLLEYFPVRVYSSTVRYRKPHPRIFEMALEQVGVVAERAVFIGDLLKADVQGARRAGMKAVWKPAANASFKKVRHQPDWMIKRITQLPEILPKLGWRGEMVKQEV